MERKAYSTNLTNAQWQRLQAYLPSVSLFPKARNGRMDRRRKYPLREVTCPEATRLARLSRLDAG